VTPVSRSELDDTSADFCSTRGGGPPLHVSLGWPLSEIGGLGLKSNSNSHPQEQDLAAPVLIFCFVR
jgi:hypothetical protein